MFYPRIRKLFQAKLQRFRRASRHGRHVTIYLEYSVNDSKSLQTPLTNPVPSLNCPNLFPMPCKAIATYIHEIENNTRSRPSFSHLKYLKKYNRGHCSPNQNPRFSPSEFSFDIWMKDFAENACAAELVKQDVKDVPDLFRSLFQKLKKQSNVI